MRKFLLTGAMALSLSISGAGAASLSMNEAVLADGTDMEMCKQMGVAAIAKAGLKPAGSSPASVFGEGPGGLIAAVYCLPDRGIAMVGVAGDSSKATRPVLAALLGALNAQ